MSMSVPHPPTYQAVNPSRPSRQPKRPYYLGEVQHNTRHGFGTYFYENTFFRYEGEWLNSKKHGHGKFFLSDGCVYEGNFEQGEMTGKGCKRWPNNSKTYIGEFKLGEHCGRGVMTYTQKNCRYEGDWLNNKWHGEGKWVDCSTGEKYVGSFIQHRRHGNGIHTLHNGECYDGLWENNLRHGVGRFASMNGNDYNGEWSEGLEHGRGRFYHAESGIVYDGEWIHGSPGLIPRCLSAVACVKAVVVGEPLKLTVQVCSSDGRIVTEESGRTVRLSVKYKKVMRIERRRAPVEEDTTPTLSRGKSRKGDRGAGSKSGGDKDKGKHGGGSGSAHGKRDKKEHVEKETDAVSGADDGDIVTTVATLDGCVGDEDVPEGVCVEYDTTVVPVMVVDMSRGVATNITSENSSVDKEEVVDVPSPTAYLETKTSAGVTTFTVSVKAEDNGGEFQFLLEDLTRPVYPGPLELLSTTLCLSQQKKPPLPAVPTEGPLIQDGALASLKIGEDINTQRKKRSVLRK